MELKFLGQSDQNKLCCGSQRERENVSFNICISTVISKYRERQSKKGRRGGWGGSLNAKAKERKDINVGDSKGKKN